MSALASISGVIKGIGNFITGTVSVIGGLFADLFGRTLGIPGFALDLIGLRAGKKLRLRFIILRDQNAVQLVPEDNLIATINLTRRIYDEQANVDVVLTGISVAAGVPPDGALNVTGAVGSFAGLWGTSGSYFNGLAGYGFFTRRLSVIIVDTIEGHGGRSFGPVCNYVLVERSFFNNPSGTTRIVAHEIGHACGISLHSGSPSNLMHKDYTGENLTRWQSSIIRSSRFVWFL